MRFGKGTVLTVMGFLFVFCLWGSQSIISRAEETEVPGYHVYTTTEEEAIDTWYGIARGTYLQSGTSGIVRAGTGKVSVSGTIGSYYFERENASTCYGSKANIPVTIGWYYRARGGHSVTEGSTTESTTTKTAWLRAT